MNEANEIKELDYQLDVVNKERELVAKILANYKARIEVDDKIAESLPILKNLRSEVETLRNAYKNK